MEFLYILTTSEIVNPIKDKILGVFEDNNQARDAGLWWSVHKSLSEDISWHKVGDTLEVAEIAPSVFLHIKTIKANQLLS